MLVHCKNIINVWIIYKYIFHFKYDKDKEIIMINNIIKSLQTIPVRLYFVAIEL